MRNLKRALSLALASVMLLGMMVVGTSAASYPDVDENDNVEAIEVLNAVKVMIGKQGNFEPDAAVNRHEMATIMAKLVLGVETADNYVGSHPFTDVHPWADKYVAACYENGLVSGTSATTYGGTQPLTAVQAAAMMLRALGYKDLSKGANDWRAPVTAMANQIRLFNGVASNPSEQLNRNQVAQLALNTLKSPMVNLKDNTISWTDNEGQVIISGGSRDYIALSSHEAYAKAINDTERAGTSASGIQGYTVELGEHLYNGKLKLYNNNLDVFGRPSRKWEFDGKEIGSYIKEELLVKEYSDDKGQSKVTGNDLYTLLGASTIKEYGVNVAIDGIDLEDNNAEDILGGAYFDKTDMRRDNKKEVGDTGTGVLTQVFVDHEKDQVYVAVINTYLARAARDYDEKAEEATLSVYGINEFRTSDKYFKDLDNKADETMKVQDEDFTLVKGIKKDDSFLVTVADGEIQTMVPAEVLEAVTLTAFKKGAHVVSDGTTYKYTTTATYNQGDLDAYTTTDNTNLKDITYNIYLDAYGNLIGIKEIDAVKNYVFLAGIDLDGSNLYNKNATANALFLDGTSKTIKINMAKSKWHAHPGLNNTNVVIEGDALLNTWCTYTVNNDGVYTVTEVYATSMNPNETDPVNTAFSPDNYPQPNVIGAKNTTKLAQSWQPTTNTGKVEVKNLRLEGGGATGSAFANVYGDSTSVYLTAELDELVDRGNANGSWGIIKGVDSVSTGIADTSINVWEDTKARDKADGTAIKQTVPLDQVAYGIYTLYDSDGIVIAAVVVGENDGVKDMVYVHSSGLDLESYDSAADIWTWTRKVIFNGEEITLTEKGDSLSDLEDMEQFHWYEIKRNANGEIIDADPAFNALGSFRKDDTTVPIDPEGNKDLTYEDTFVNLYKDINEVIEKTKDDTVLYQTDGGPAYKNNPGDPACHTHKGLDYDLKVIGNNTLAVQTETGSGIHFRDNVNVVWQYWNQNTKQVEIETGTGLEAVKDMVDFVNKNNATDRMNNGVKQYYYLSALIEKNFATTIVVWDSYNSYKKGEIELTGTHLKGNATIESVNKALLDGNVIIDETWRPADLVKDNAVNTNVVKIPSNRTLMIDGDFIAYENRGADSGSIYIESGKGSKLIVNGDFDMADQTLSCDTEVNNSTRYGNEGGNMTINLRPELGRYVELYAKLNVAKDLKVKVDDEIANPVVRVNTGAYVDVKGDLTADKNDVVFTIYGTLNIGGQDDNINIIHYDVYSDSTLKAGTLYGTFCVGGGSRTGRVEVGTLNTTAATGSHKGATLNNGSLVITGTNYTKAFNIGSKAEARIVFGDKAADKAGVFLTEDKTQANVAGKTYIFTEKNGVIIVTDTNKNEFATIEGGVVDEVIDTGASEGEPGTPPTGQPIKTVTVTGLPTGTIKAGDKFTVKSSTEGVTGEVAVTAVAPTTKIDLTVTTEHEQGFASDVSISGWTLVEVSADGKTAKFTKTVDVEAGENPPAGDFDMKVEGDKASYTVTLIYEGDRPSDEAIIAKFNETLKAAGKETYEGASVYPKGGNTIYAADKTTVVGNITDEASYYVLLNGKTAKKADGTDAKFAKGETGALTIKYTGTGKFVTNKADWTGGYAVSGLSDLTVTITAGDLADLTGNLELVDAYQFPTASLDSSLTNIIYNDGEETTETSLSNPLYIPTSGSVTFTGKIKTGANAGNNTHVKLTIADKDYDIAQTVAADLVKYTVKMSELTSEMVTDGKIGTVKEVGTFAYNVYFGDVKIPVNKALTSLVLDDNPATAEILEGNYLVKANIPNGKYVAADGLTAITVKKAGGKVNVTGTLTPDDNGEVYLVPVTKVTFTKKGDAAAAFNVSGEVVIEDNAAYFVKVDETMKFAGASGETFKAMAAVGTEEAVDWWSTTGTKVPNVADPTKGVAITILQAVKEVKVETKKVTAEQALELQKTGTNDTIGAPTAGATPTVPADGAADAAEIVVTVAAADGFYFASALVPTVTDTTTGASDDKIDVALKAGSAKINEDGKLEFTVTVKNNNAGAGG